MATSNGSTAIRDKILASLARYRALRIGKFPCAFWRLSSRPGLTALDILQQHTAGNPMNSSIRWTYLKPREIVSELLKKGYSVSRNIVRYLLKEHEYVKRKAQKNMALCES